MKIIVRFLALILCTTLTLAVNSSQNIGSKIRIAHCRSICLTNYTGGGVRCMNNTIMENHCLDCWNQCYELGTMQEETRHTMCSESLKKLPNYSGMFTACVFYKTRGAEKDKYKPSKLPAPEKCKTIHMKDHDVAVVMRRNYEGRWLDNNYYFTNKILPDGELPDGAWIIVASEDGTLRHYSWEIWKPTLESLQESDSLYQAHITWKDWYIQLEQQIQEAYPLYYDKLKTGFYLRKEKLSFVVTWQYETGDGIMGNQVTDSESAHISLSANSEYLVRITTDDSPGSYPIVIDTRNRIIDILLLKVDKQLNSFLQIIIYAIFPVVMIMFLICCLELFLYLYSKLKKPSSKPNKIMNILEEGRLKTTKKSGKKQRDSHYTCQVLQNISKTTPNANLQTAIANSQKMKANSLIINANKMQKQTCKISDSAAGTV